MQNGTTANAKALLENYFSICRRHSLDGTYQFDYAKKQETEARAAVLAVDPDVFARREREALAESRARLGIVDPE